MSGTSISPLCSWVLEVRNEVIFDCGISSLGDTQNLTKQGPEQPEQTSELALY